MNRIARRAFAVLALLPVAGVVAFFASDTVRDAGYSLWGRLRGGYTVGDRLSLHADDVARRLRPRFAAAGLDYPPGELAFLSFKDARRLEVHARMAPGDPWRRVLDYPVLAASGHAGPKLLEGDRQVPEGIYAAESLNPNSRFHLSIRLDYPNAFDREMAQRDGRVQLGGDIMIHGNAVSVGCLAMGNRAAEDLFVLAALVGKERLRIVVSPTDFRHAATVAPEPSPAAEAASGADWTAALYASIRSELQQYPSEH